MLQARPPAGRAEIEAFLLEELPALGPPPRGAEGLARARRFFGRLGDPQHAARQVHVVGTAGKGTAVAAIVARLVGPGRRVGAHVSPHVFDLRERFLLDGRLPDWDEVDAAVDEVWPAMHQTVADEGRPPSFFEVTTAISWLIGRRAGVDIHVTEAGIGGEYDATNAIDQPDKITVVMPIGLDHREILGHDVREIARTKAAVIQDGGDVVVAPQPHGGANDVVLSIARGRGARVHPVLPTDDAPIPFLAQAEAVAAMVAELVGIGTGGNAVPAPVHLPGRLEAVHAGGRTLLLDGAHNPLKLAAVRAALSEAPTVVVTAVSHEKDLEACAAELARLGDVFITTDFVVAAGDRAVRHSWSAHQLAEAIRRHRPEVDVTAVPGVGDAVRASVSHTHPGDTVLATGSFMMLAGARESFTEASLGADAGSLSGPPATT